MMWILPQPPFFPASIFRWKEGGFFIFFLKEWEEETLHQTLLICQVVFTALSVKDKEYKQ